MVSEPSNLSKKYAIMWHIVIMLCIVVCNVRY